MNAIRCLATLPLLWIGAASLAAQSAGTVLVAAAVPGTSATVLYEVDLGSGALTVLPRFPADVAPPLAVTVDPTDGSLLAAVDSGGGSLVVRLRRGPAGLSEQVLGTVSAPASVLLVDRLGDVVVLAGGPSGGAFRLPRHGGAAATVRSQPFVTAAFSPNPLAWGALVGLSGRAGPPVVDPGIGWLDLDNGQFSTPPTFFAGYTPRGITGVLDLPTALPRQLLAHDDGSFSLFDPLLAPLPTPVTTAPVLPAGGAATVKWESAGGVVLGDSRNPMLFTFDPLTALGGTMVLNPVVAPLFGDPVDFATVPPPAAGTLAFVPACGRAAELRITGLGGPPRLGNAAFAIGLAQGLPLQPSLIAVGLSELTGVPLPNGCAARVLPAAVAFHLTNPNGDATQPLPVPNSQGLLGLLLFAQWFQDDSGLPFLTSPVLGIRVGAR